MTESQLLDLQVRAVRDKRAAAAFLFGISWLICLSILGPLPAEIAAVRFVTGIVTLVAGARWIAATAELLTLQERAPIRWWTVLLRRPAELVKFPGLLGE